MLNYLWVSSLNLTLKQLHEKSVYIVFTEKGQE